MRRHPRPAAGVLGGGGGGGGDASLEDPLAIFESHSPPQMSHYGNKAKASSSSSSSPSMLFIQRYCKRQYRVYWLCGVWLLIILIMTTISWRVYEQVNGPLPASAAEGILSMFFPNAWKLKRSQHNKRHGRKGRRTAKTILYYNKYWNFDNFQFGEAHKPFVDANCPIHDCVAVQYRPTHHTDDYLSSFDAVLFHAASLDVTELPQITKWRKPHQRFIYMNMESPLSSPTAYHRRLDHFFNWTMTYRLDSDLPRPYGFFEFTAMNKRRKAATTPKSTGSTRYHPEQWQPLQSFVPYMEQVWLEKVLPLKGEAFYQLAKRPKQVAWIVSRCDSPSHREDYVRELQKYIDVDIFGVCGNMPCNTTFSLRQLANDNCTQLVERNYKFYLAFENSLCQDYVTEKFYRRLQSNNSPLVVVLGGANYTKLAPPHSHINAMDYSSPKALANKLHELDHNDSQYLSYFWWKDYYTVHAGTPQDHASTMCKLCEMLHHTDVPPKVYPSIAYWHDPKSQCRNIPNTILNISTTRATDDDGKLLDD